MSLIPGMKCFKEGKKMSKIRILKVEKPQAIGHESDGKTHVLDRPKMNWVEDGNDIVVEFDTAGEGLRWLKKQIPESGCTYHFIRIVKTMEAVRKVVESTELAEK